MANSHFPFTHNKLLSTRPARYLCSGRVNQVSWLPVYSLWVEPQEALSRVREEGKERQDVAHVSLALRREARRKQLALSKSQQK